jgi:hypothetical protein
MIEVEENKPFIYITSFISNLPEEKIDEKILFPTLLNIYNQAKNKSKIVYDELNQQSQLLNDHIVELNGIFFFLFFFFYVVKKKLKKNYLKVVLKLLYKKVMKKMKIKKLII